MLKQMLLTDRDTEQIRDVALKTLETVGMMFQSERLLKALEEKGARIDWPRERAFIPRRLVLAVIEQERVPQAASPLPTRLRKPGGPGIGMQVAQLLYDHRLQRSREPLQEDFLRMIRFGEALHGDGGVGHTVVMRDVPQPLEPLVAQKLLIEHTRRPGSAYFYYAEQLPYAAEIGEIHSGNPREFCGGGVFLTSPLRLCRRSCNLVSARIDMGFGGSASTMPVAGASVPATMAGAIALTAAEILGAWTCYRALKEDAPVGGGVATGAIDMRTGCVSFSSPEAMVLNLGTSEFFRRLCGKGVGVGGASDYCDAKVPGLRAAIEKAHKAMTVCAFTGSHPGVGGGLIDSGKTLSPEQVLIERDFSAGVGRLFAPIDVTEDTLAEEAILKVAQGLDVTHLETEHTLLHCREALWAPTFHCFDSLRDQQAEFDRDRGIVDKAHALYNDIADTYVAPEADGDRLRAIEAVIGRARKDMHNWDLG